MLINSDNEFSDKSELKLSLTFYLWATKLLAHEALRALFRPKFAERILGYGSSSNQLPKELISALHSSSNGFLFFAIVIETITNALLVAFIIIVSTYIFDKSPILLQGFDLFNFNFGKSENFIIAFHNITEALGTITSGLLGALFVIFQLKLALSIKQQFESEN